MTGKLLIVGNAQPFHVGAHFLSAARQIGLEAQLIDIRRAHSGNIWVNRIFHRLGRRPAHLERFSQSVITKCRELNPELLLVTGISAPSGGALKIIHGMNISCANYLTDDPWNPAQGAKFFWSALKKYDVIWSPRRANMSDLRIHGCRRVEYLPFAYNPKLHYPERPHIAEERERFACDVVWVGGADSDRLPIAHALLQAGIKVRLYGGYWDRDTVLRPHWCGFVHGRDLRLVVGGAKVNICLGRKANRDGHAMRSLELPAMGACMLVEDTLEHRELFGADAEYVEYYTGLEELTAKAKALCAQPERARALGQKVFHRICEMENHTYADRLRQILTHKAAG